MNGEGLKGLFQIPELRKRVLFTLFILLVYRLGIYVPTPGVDAVKLTSLLGRGMGSLFDMVNMFSGGAMEQFSVFALGIMPYINVSIAIQLLAAVLKPLQELQEQGEHGRRIITKYTRLGTVGLALVHGFLIASWLESQGVVLNPGLQFKVITSLTLTTGTIFIMWIGEQVNERGIGNGISVIIMAGIVARMPATFERTLRLMGTGEITPFAMLGIMAFAVATIGFIVYTERCQRRIPVQYPRRAVGRRMTQPTTQHLPLKLNSAGVVPPIFASMLSVFSVTVLHMLSSFLEANSAAKRNLDEVVSYMSPPNLVYELFYAALIIAFSFFWISTVPQLSPNKIAENLKKNGGFIPTVRPGRDTAAFLEGVMIRLTFWGSLYLCIVCIVPSLFYHWAGATAFTYFFGGTAVLIVVGVTVDTASQIGSYIVTRNYESFMSKGATKVRGGFRGPQIKGSLIQR